MSKWAWALFCRCQVVAVTLTGTMHMLAWEDLQLVLSHVTKSGDETQVSNVTKAYYCWKAKAVNAAWDKTHILPSHAGCGQRTDFLACPQGTGHVWVMPCSPSEFIKILRNVETSISFQNPQRRDPERTVICKGNHFAMLQCPKYVNIFCPELTLTPSFQTSKKQKNSLQKILFSCPS